LVAPPLALTHTVEHLPRRVRQLGVHSVVLDNCFAVRLQGLALAVGDRLDVITELPEFGYVRLHAAVRPWVIDDEWNVTNIVVHTTLMTPQACLPKEVAMIGYDEKNGVVPDTFITKERIEVPELVVEVPYLCVVQRLEDHRLAVRYVVQSEACPD